MRNIARRLLRGLVWLVVIGVGLSVALVAVLRWVDPPTSAFMIRHALIASGDPDWRWPRHRWVDWADIAPSMRLAVVAAEDQRFPVHGGFDFESIAKAIEQHREGEPLRGASTISQQVAKNLFLWPGRNFVRKGLEAWFTLLIETLWPKRRILEVYLNIAQLGPDTYGVGAASELFFDVPANALGRDQAALLAAVLPNPRELRVSAPSGYVRERQRWIVRQMARLGGSGYLNDLSR